MQNVDPAFLTNATSFLTAMSALSTAVQQFVEHAIKKRIAWLDHPNGGSSESNRASMIHLITFAVGAVLSWSVGLQPLALLGLSSATATPTIQASIGNSALAGVMIAFGSSFFDEALGAVREFKKAQNGAQPPAADGSKGPKSRQTVGV